MATVFKKKIKTKNKIDQIKRCVKIVCILNGIKISDTESIIITQFILEGFNKSTREEILNQKLVKNYNNLANLISSLRDKGIIVKNGFREELSEDFINLKSSHDKLALMILLDNTSE